MNFRAWIPSRKEMFYPDNEFSFIAMGKIFKLDPQIDNVCYYPVDIDVEVMRGTGIKDWQGKEIFEGDVINGLVVSYCGDKNDDLGMNAGFYLQRDDFESWVELEVEQDIVVDGHMYQDIKIL